MKYLLSLHMNPTLWETLTEAQKDGIYQGHGEFHKLISESGEMVETKALADPSQTKTIRVRKGAVQTVDGPSVELETFFCGYYIVDVDDEKRAVELAALIPDAQYTEVEVRPIIHEAGPA